MNLIKRILLISTNYWPFCHLVLAMAPLWVPGQLSLSTRIGLTMGLLYFAPPLFCRLLLIIFGEPRSGARTGSRGFMVWWMTAQIQTVFVRFAFLEEILRIVPGFYSAWLRLWGARIGKFVYWGPQLKVMDRPFLNIEDFAVIGYGVGFTSHHLNPVVKPDGQKAMGEMELVFGIPTVRKNAVLGGLSGMGPGSEVAESELLPSTMLLAPGYLWKDGRRRAKEVRVN
jgi:hypothetical protein